MSLLINKVLISVFISFPEAILILLLGFILINLKVEIKKIILIAGIQAVVAFLVQILNIPFGLHTVVQVTSLWILVSLILNVKLYKASVSILSGSFITAINQGVIVLIVNLLSLELDYIKLRVDFIYTFIFAFPVITLSFIVFIVIKSKNYTIF